LFLLPAIGGFVVVDFAVDWKVDTIRHKEEVYSRG
jgi:hypothetical protein